MARIPRTAIILFFFVAPEIGVAAEPLFKQPLHLTREIVDPIDGRTTTVEEYFVGNRAISICGEVTSIVDYAKGEAIRIDRARGTWSQATLEALARAARATRGRDVSAGTEWNVRAEGSGKGLPGRVSIFRASSAPDSTDRAEMVIAIDQSVTLTRDGAEILAGSAWPNEPRPESAAVLRAARGDGAAAAAAIGSPSPGERYGLPVETTLSWREGSEELRFVNRVVRIGAELPPSGLLEIPRGARRIDDPRVAAAALLEALDQAGAPKE